MQVALIAQPFDGVLPPNQNSIGLIVYNTAVELSRSTSVSVFVGQRRDHRPSASLPFTTELVETPVADRLASFASLYPRWSSRLGIQQRLDSYPAYARKAAELSRNRSVDVVHIMNYWQWPRTIRRSGARVVLEMQSEWLAQMNRKRVLEQLDFVDAVVGVSNHISDQFSECFPEYAGRIGTAYNGVDTDTFHPVRKSADSLQHRRGNPTILFVGRLSPEKGVHVLLEAFAELIRAFPNAKLDLAGPRTTLPSRYLVDVSADPRVKSLSSFYNGKVARDYQSHLDNLVVKYGLKNNVRFLGSLPHKELVASYQAADLLVNPSFSESFGISIVEGMAVGIPVIGTRVGGMAETILDGETGFLVEPDRPDELAQAITKVLDSFDIGDAMGQKGRSRVTQTFSWRARASRLLDTYSQLLEE